MYSDRPRRFFAPVKAGDELDLKIEAVGEKGDGIAKVKGFVIFVPNTQKDQECRVRINRVVKKVGFGESLGPAQGPVVVDEQKPAQKQEESPEISEDSGEEQSEESTEEHGEESQEEEY